MKTSHSKTLAVSSATLAVSLTRHCHAISDDDAHLPFGLKSVTAARGFATIIACGSRAQRRPRFFAISMGRAPTVAAAQSRGKSRFVRQSK